jgi:hypothetical protein
MIKSLRWRRVFCPIAPRPSLVLSCASPCSIDESSRHHRENLGEEKMNKLKRPAAAVVITLVMAFVTFAGEMQSPPCSPPGEMQSPPCSATQLSSDDPVQGQTQTTTTSTAVTETIITDTAIDLVVQSILSLF